MSLITMKFGGTSVGNPERIRGCARIVAEYARRDSVVAVVSAFAGVTDSILCAIHAAKTGARDELEEQLRTLETRHEDMVAGLFANPARDEIGPLIRQVLVQFREFCCGLRQLRGASPQLVDMALSVGEEISAQIFSAHLNLAGTRAEYVDSAGLVITDEKFGEANPDLEATRRKSRQVLGPLLDKGVVPVVTGYRGATVSGHLTTLGRGGSDYSATLLGAALNCDEILIWTDVDGVLTADPGICPEARLLQNVSFAEAVELSYYGAKVIHERAIRPAMDSGIPVWIKNSLRPGLAGTKIAAQLSPSAFPVKAVSAVRRASLLTIRARSEIHFAEVLGRLFLCLGQEHIDVLFSTQSSSENVIGLALREHDTERVLQILQRLFRIELKHGILYPIGVDGQIAVIAVLGEAMKGVAGIAARLFSAVARLEVSVIAIAQGASELNICFAVPAISSNKVVRAIHHEFLTEHARAEVIQREEHCDESWSARSGTSRS